jgi:hypothetical protein
MMNPMLDVQCCTDSLNTRQENKVELDVDGRLINHLHNALMLAFSLQTLGSFFNYFFLSNLK